MSTYRHTHVRASGTAENNHVYADFPTDTDYRVVREQLEVQAAMAFTDRRAQNFVTDLASTNPIRIRVKVTTFMGLPVLVAVTLRKDATVNVRMMVLTPQASTSAHEFDLYSSHADETYPSQRNFPRDGDDPYGAYCQACTEHADETFDLKVNNLLGLNLLGL